MGRLFSIASRHFQPVEGPRRGLLLNCKTSHFKLYWTEHRPHLVSDPLDLCLVLEQLVEGGAVLDDEGRDREEGKQQHVHLQQRTGEEQ